MKQIRAFSIGIWMALATYGAFAQTSLKVGVVAEMSGPEAEYGLQMTNGMKLYLKEHGDVFAGRRIDLLVRDVGGPNAEVAKRLAQELIVRDKVTFLAGFGFTPNALAVAPLATEAKIPMVVMNAAASVVTTRSPYIVRVSMTEPQLAFGIAQWASRNNIKKVYTLTADYAPGHDAENQFKTTFLKAGGQIVESVEVPLNTTEFGPYVERIKEVKPDAVFFFMPSGQLAGALLKSFSAGGLQAAGIKLIATGDAVDDTSLDAMGDSALGIVTAGHYSVAHDSAENRRFTTAYRSAFGADVRPNFMAVAGYDGMAAICNVVSQLKGDVDGDNAMRLLAGMTLDSPRGPLLIDAATRDVVQTIYIRRVERRDGHLYNVEFEQIPAVKDPGKDASK